MNCNGGNNSEGVDGTDRSNICQTSSLASLTCLCDGCFGSGVVPMFSAADRARFAFAGQTASDCDELSVLKLRHNNNEDAIEKDQRNCMKLNAAPAHFDGGVIAFNTVGKMTFMSTRNTNFGNRMQTGSITVLPVGASTPPPSVPGCPAGTLCVCPTESSASMAMSGLSMAVNAFSLFL
jgi:hypothetical protein